MKNLQLIVYRTDKGTPVTDSVLIAEYLNRRHSNITKAIRRIIEQGGGSNFYQSTYINGGKVLPKFVMNKRGFIDVTKTIHGITLEVSEILGRFEAVEQAIGDAPLEKPAIAPETKEAGEDGQQATGTLFEPSNGAERENEAPEASQEETMSYIIGRLAILEKNQAAINGKLDAILDFIAKAGRGQAATPQRPSTIKITQELVTIGELAKMLCQYGITTGEMRLFQWMRDNQFLCAMGSEYNLPRQKYIEQGLFVIKASRVQLPNGQIIEKNTTKVTAKGQEYFINRFLYNQQQGK